MTSVYIGIAGILGALTRYAISLSWNPALPESFPWGTLLCNFAGCLMLGFFAFAAKLMLPDSLRASITVGFIGSFTTFSTFSYETVDMLRTGHVLQAFLYINVSLWGGLALAWLGSRLGQSFRSRGEQL